MPLSSTETDINLNVLRFTQDKTMSCWFAAAQTVLSYRSIGMAIANPNSNIDTLIRVFENDGIRGDVFEKFASEVGLNTSQSVFDRQFTREAYFVYLSKLGPLWVPCIFPDRPGGRGHIVAVVGVVKNSLMIADPDGSQSYPKWMSVEDFESVRAKQFPILYKIFGPMQ